MEEHKKGFFHKEKNNASVEIKTAAEKLADNIIQEKTVTLTDSEYQALLVESQKAKELQDKLLRLQADFENARKRLEKEKSEFIKYANEGIIVELLSVLDDLERSLEAAEKRHEDYDAFLKGVEMILAHIYEILKNNNVQAIKAQGEKFDPHLHEALLQAETDEFPEGTVIEELQKGYQVEGRVIRTSKVKVAKAKEKDKKLNEEVK
ncbi:MAG: nucleotide exchange factor GrpE [Candidatus Omnitrophota bacterium]|nr:nucleotide exchange factor GrpE [Candidatus Omnitrophota bacterium]